ncbi:thioredoxin domain-containing protein [Priestia filamentosa]|uniref:thioredoxin domain-containing protein n=1 Tax=Priestia filamentosa TaxID=1402861 RepID=UPI00397E7733
MKPRIIFVTTFILILLISAIGFSQMDEEINAIANQYHKKVEFDLKDKISIGSKDAPNAIVIFQDYECSRCKQFHEKVAMNLREDIDNGKVKLYYYDVPFTNETSYVKAMLGVVFEKRHAAYYDQYIRAMYRLTREENEQFGDEKFVQEKMNKLFPNLDLTADIEQVFKDDESLVNELKENQKLVNKENITKVPTVFVNGKRIKNLFNLNHIKEEYMQ